MLDAGPVYPVEEFLPYRKSIPLLEKIADRVGAPLVAVLMSWERGGPWVYPDCFPPVGGDESLKEFASMARDRGWHVGSFCNGTRWVTGHFWNGYDGWEFYHENDGQSSVCRTPAGEPWPGGWDRNWRPSFIGCLGTEKTREIAKDFVRRLIGWGLESIQFFDQNVNAATFPCYAEDHEHPSVPGKWMPEKMAEIITRFSEEAATAGEERVIQSTECPCNEYCLPLFQQCDVRVGPPGSITESFVPVYHYLYHDCIIMHGMMGYGPEPYHLQIRNAYNGVLGEIPGAVMTGKGGLLNKETGNWANWEPVVGNNDHSLEMIKTVTALRRGPAKDYLVYGRMQFPVKTADIQVERWEYGNQIRNVPAVFHASWKTPDGCFGLVLANWTDREQKVRIEDARFQDKLKLHLSGKVLECKNIINGRDGVEVIVPALGCALLENAENNQNSGGK